MISISEAAVNRRLEWETCCSEILGWKVELIDTAEKKDRNNRNTGLNNGFTLVHLSQDNSDSKRMQTPQDEQPVNHDNNSNNTDPDAFWRAAIDDVETNLDRMVAWLHEKQWIFRSPETTDQEASLIQSTIGSYTVTTANELEHLRRHYQQHIATSTSKTKKSTQEQQHDRSVIQILSERLKEQVAEPFGRLQKERQRAAVTLWQNPLSCRFVPSLSSRGDDKNSENDNSMDQVLGLEPVSASETERIHRKFVPNQPRHVLRQEHDFLDAYKTHENVSSDAISLPSTFFSQRWKRPRSPAAARNDNVSEKTASSASLLHNNSQQQQQPDPNKRSKPSNTPPATPTATNSNIHNDDGDNEFMYQSVDAEELNHESTLLQAQQQQHDLDAVQGMETKMVEIVGLLTQFSELVSEQQEEVWQIHDHVATAKENMDKGQEELVDATQRTDSSKHYMASAIAGMGMALLFFHWIRP